MWAGPTKPPTLSLHVVGPHFKNRLFVVGAPVNLRIEMRKVFATVGLVVATVLLGLGCFGVEDARINSVPGGRSVKLILSANAEIRIRCLSRPNNNCPFIAFRKSSFSRVSTTWLDTSCADSTIGRFHGGVSLFWPGAGFTDSRHRGHSSPRSPPELTTT